MVNINLEIYFLGTSASVPTVTRNLSAVAIKYGGEVILFDCGEGTQRQIIKTKGISFMKIRTIFITHFHGDHYLGLLGLLQTMTMHNRKKELYIYGPKGTVNFLKNYFKSGYVGIGFPVYVKDLQSGERIAMEKYEIRCFILTHHDIPTLGYIFEEFPRPGRFDKKKALELGIPEGPLFRKLQSGESIKIGDRIITPEMVLGPQRPGRKIVYAVDTVPSDIVVESSLNADVLIHDATGSDKIKERIHEYGHTTAKEAAEIAIRANVQCLVLTHISPRYEEEGEKLLEEARSIFPNTLLAEDMLILPVKLRK